MARVTCTIGRATLRPIRMARTRPIASAASEATSSSRRTDPTLSSIEPTAARCDAAARSCSAAAAASTVSLAPSRSEAARRNWSSAETTLCSASP